MQAPGIFWFPLPLFHYSELMNQSNLYERLVIVALAVFASLTYHAQEVPSPQENIPYLVTFGMNSDHSWGDDDFSQTVFFSIPKSQTAPVYLRIYDPETGGELDEINCCQYRD